MIDPGTTWSNSRLSADAEYVTSTEGNATSTALAKKSLFFADHTAADQNKQETQLSQTNRATHLCKCNDVADLTSVIKICLKKSWCLASGLSKSLKVIGTDTNRPAIYELLLVFCSNFFPKTHCFWDIWLQKSCDLENQVRGPSMSLEMSPFDRAHTTSY